MKIELKDPTSVRKMQHMVLAMERIAQLLDQQTSYNRAMTDTEIKYVKKLKAYIKKCDKILGEWECSEISLTKLRREIAELGKQCQFELLYNPDIYEASANEHFEQEEKIELIKSTLYAFRKYMKLQGEYITESDIQGYIDLINGELK